MRKWTTEFKALDAKTGEMKTWVGDEVGAPTFELAQEWCYNNKGHLTVVGELICEIPCKAGSYNPDFNLMIDYEKIKSN